MEDKYCICLGWLTTYWVTNINSDVAKEIPSDFARRCHAIVDSPEIPRKGLKGVISKRTIQCFTMAEAYRFVEWEIFEKRRPVHRVLELVNEQWIEIVECTNKPNPERAAALRELQNAAMERLKRRATT